MACSVIAFSWPLQMKGKMAAPIRSPFCPVAPRRMLSSTVRRDRLLVSWKVRTMPLRASLYEGMFVTLAPS